MIDRQEFPNEETFQASLAFDDACDEDLVLRLDRGHWEAAFVAGWEYGRAQLLQHKKTETEATTVHIYGMYDCHLFHRIRGISVDEVIANWLAHNASLQPAIVGGETIDDLGPSYLCPAIVLAGERELRRVGQMVFPDATSRQPKDLAAVEAYRTALLADPDIPRLLAMRKDK